TTTALCRVGPQLIKHSNVLVAACRACVVDPGGLDYGVENGKLDLPHCDVCFCTQCGRAFDNPLHYLEHPTTGLFDIIVANSTLGVTAAEQQGGRQGMDSSERRFAALLRTGINLLGIEQTTISICLEGVLEEFLFDRQQSERLVGLGINQ